jgi:hypothetical protein
MNPPRIHDAADVIAIIDQWARSCGAVQADRRSYCAWQIDAGSLSSSPGAIMVLACSQLARTG